MYVAPFILSSHYQQLMNFVPQGYEIHNTLYFSLMNNVYNVHIFAAVPEVSHAAKLI